MLLGDAGAAFICPLPHPFQELFPAYLVAVGAFLGQQSFHYHLRGDTGMVDARQPQRGVSFHPVPARHRILDGSG